MTDLIDTTQLQEIGDALIELFDIILPDGTTRVYLCNGLDDGETNIYFPNKAGTALNEYISIPIQLEGIEATSSGAQARPSLQMANIPTLVSTWANNNDGVNDVTTFLNILTANNLLYNEDFLNSRVEYRTTLLSKTYKVTDVSGWSTTLPVEFPSAKFIVDRVASENPLTVEFELASPIDLEGVKLPGRVVIGKYCPWRYQGYTLAAEGGCIWPLDSNGRFFDIDDNIIAKKVSGVLMHFYNDSATTVPLPEYSSGASYSMVTTPSSSAPPTRVFTSTILFAIMEITMTNEGSGYQGQSPAVTFSGGGGTAAAATAVVVGDKVKAITINNYGSNYTTVPAVAIAAPTGIGGTTATATVRPLELVQIWRLVRDAPAGKTPDLNPFYWYREDVCGKIISSCKNRFQGNNTDTSLNTAKTLPFGGFPGSKAFK